MFGFDIDMFVVGYKWNSMNILMSFIILLEK